MQLIKQEEGDKWRHLVGLLLCFGSNLLEVSVMFSTRWLNMISLKFLARYIARSSTEKDFELLSFFKVFRAMISQ